MNNYELLWECFMSDQMTAKQLDEHIREDGEFAEFVMEKVRQLREEESE